MRIQAHLWLLQTLKIKSQHRISQIKVVLGQRYPSNNPCSVANRFIESSLSLLVLTNPQSAYVVCCPGMMCPFSSTCPILIWTEAWSFAVMSRLVAALQRDSVSSNNTIRRIPFAGDVKVNDFTLILQEDVSNCT